MFGFLSAAGLTTVWFITDHMRPDQPRAQQSAVSNLMPAITPVQGGATAGVTGIF
jgi:hypothetical protein